MTGVQTCALPIYTTAETTDIEIVLSRKVAYKFKNHVESLMNLNSKIINNQDKDEKENSNFKIAEINGVIDYDITYSVMDVIKHCLYNLALGGVVFNLIVIIVIGVISFNADGVEGLVTISLMFIVCLFNLIRVVIGDFLKYYNFAIKRQGDRLYIRCGLIKKKEYTVPVSRINAININQKLIARTFKRYNVDIVTIGVGDDDSESSQILLCSKKDKLIENIKILLPEIELEEEVKLEREPVEQVYLRVAKILIVGIILSVILGVGDSLLNAFMDDIVIEMSVYMAIVALYLVLASIIYYFKYKTMGIYLGKDNMILSFGTFDKKISLIKYEKIQYL